MLELARPGVIVCQAMRTVCASIATLLLTSVATASTANHPLQHGVSQGVSVDVYAPERVVFDLTQANATSSRRGRRGYRRVISPAAHLIECDRFLRALG